MALAYLLLKMPQIVKKYKNVPQDIKILYWATIIAFVIQFAIVVYLLPNIVECSMSGNCGKIAWFLLAFSMVFAVEKLLMFIYTVEAI